MFVMSSRTARFESATIYIFLFYTTAPSRYHVYSIIYCIMVIFNNKLFISCAVNNIWVEKCVVCLYVFVFVSTWKINKIRVSCSFPLALKCTYSLLLSSYNWKLSLWIPSTFWNLDHVDLYMQFMCVIHIHNIIIMVRIEKIWAVKVKRY